MKMTPIALALLWLVLSAVPVTADGSDSEVAAVDTVSAGSVAQLLTAELKPDEAVVWYLFHCGYAIKTQSKLLIFDYVRGNWTSQVPPASPSLANGWINPEEVKDLDVYVFVSHSHIDHFDTTVLGWSESVPAITYFFGWDEGTGEQSNNLVGPRASFVSDQIEIHTINSHHSGVPEVAYLVKTDGLVIYHGGDYTGSVSEDVSYLKQKTDRIDIAMLNDHCGDAVMKIVDTFRPRMIFAGHNGGQEEDLGDISKCCRDEGLPCEVMNPTGRGDVFRYQSPAGPPK